MIAAIRRWRDETGDTHALRAARVVVGLLLLEAAFRAGRELQDGYFGDVFHWPVLPEALLVPKWGYAALVGAEGVAGAMAVAGTWARPALFASALMSTYVLLCDRVQFHHNRWALAAYALLLSLTPCDRATPASPREGLRSGRRPADTPKEQPLWAARLAQLQVAIIYLASGGSKLLDPDWRSGRVLLARFALYGGQAVDAGVPRALVEWLGEPGPTGVLAALAIATELGLAVALWPRRTRAFALWWGVWFHLTIEATSRVEGFTWLTIALYALFARPDAGARKLEYDPSRASARALARALAWSDWLGRFEIVRRPARDPGDARSLGPPDRRGLVVIDRDGTRETGARALAATARCVPLLFPLWVPIALVARLRLRSPI
jgi:hypothetical protein